MAMALPPPAVTALGAATLTMALGAALAAWATVPAAAVATARPTADLAVVGVTAARRRVHCLWQQRAVAGAG